MRKGWRVVVAALGPLLLGGVVPAVSGARGFDPSSGGGDRPIRLTVEVAWSNRAAGEAGAGDVELEVSEGQVIGAVATDPTAAASTGDPGPGRNAAGVWRLGPR